MWEYKQTYEINTILPSSHQVHTKVFSSIVLHSLLVTTCFCISSKEPLAGCHQSQGHRFHFSPLGGRNLNGVLYDDGLQVRGRGWIVFLHCRSGRGLVGTCTKKDKEQKTLEPSLVLIKNAGSHTAKLVAPDTQKVFMWVQSKNRLV